MKKTLLNSALVATSFAAGTLIYTGFLSPAREFDFTRAVFVGVFVGAFSAIFSRKK